MTLSPNQHDGVTAPDGSVQGGGVAGHTPGPWLYRPGQYDDWGWVCTEDRGFIAQAKDPRARDEDTLQAHREARTDPWEANARLIAAAPDLLDALLLILPLAKGYAPEGQTATAKRTCNSWVEAAEEAIALAIGASQ